MTPTPKYGDGLPLHGTHPSRNGAGCHTTPFSVRAGSSVRENSGLSSAAVIPRGPKGRKADGVQRSNTTLEAPQVRRRAVTTACPRGLSRRRGFPACRGFKSHPVHFLSVHPPYFNTGCSPTVFITLHPERRVMPERWSEADARGTPVTDGCLWCKQDTPSAVRIPVGEREYLCPNCLGDLREWARYRQVEMFVTSGLEPALQRIVLDHWDAITADLAREYDSDPADLFPLPTRKSNADTYEQPADSRTSDHR